MVNPPQSLPAPDPPTYTVNSFCRAHNLSRACLYNLWGEGKGPRRMKVGRRTFISGEAAADWRRRMEQGTVESNCCSECGG